MVYAYLLIKKAQFQYEIFKCTSLALITPTPYMYCLNSYIHVLPYTRAIENCTEVNRRLVHVMS